MGCGKWLVRWNLSFNSIFLMWDKQKLIESNYKKHKIFLRNYIFIKFSSDLRNNLAKECIKDINSKATHYYSIAGLRQYGKEWVGAWILLTTDISHCYAEKGEKWRKFLHLISLRAYLFTAEVQSAACYYSGCLLVHLCKMGGVVWNYLREIQMRKWGCYFTVTCGAINLLLQWENTFLLPCTWCYHLERN